MITATRAFPMELPSAYRSGMSRGLDLPGQRIRSFAEAEAAYREQRLLAEAALRTARRQARLASASERHARRSAGRSSRGSGRAVLTRWTAWLSSDRRRPSSAAKLSSGDSSC